MVKRKKFPRPRTRKIPLDSVAKFLKRRGYQVVKIWRPWRHIVAIVKKDNQELFFKMATTIKTGKMTENEFNWNERVGSQLKSQMPFLVPQNFDHGLFQDKLFFFIGSYFGDQTLADKYPPNPKQLGKWIPKIAQAAYFISQIRYQPEDKKKTKFVSDYLINSASEWASQTKADVESLLSVIKNARQKVKRCWAHGDFVPWHMYELKRGKFGLVDAEHGGYGLRYYDVAYFYVRVRQSLEEKELAKEFLNEFINLLPQKDKPPFWRDLKPILAQRLIGDYWEVSTGSKHKRESELKKREEFKQELIEDRII